MENPGMSDNQHLSELDYASIFRAITDFHLILSPRFEIVEVSALLFASSIFYAVLPKHPDKKNVT
jgi:hypothetical protein